MDCPYGVGESFFEESTPESDSTDSSPGEEESADLNGSYHDPAETTTDHTTTSGPAMVNAVPANATITDVASASPPAPFTAIGVDVSGPGTRILQTLLAQFLDGEFNATIFRQWIEEGAQQHPYHDNIPVMAARNEWEPLFYEEFMKEFALLLEEEREMSIGGACATAETVDEIVRQNSS